MLELLLECLIVLIPEWLARSSHSSNQAIRQSSNHISTFRKLFGVEDEVGAGVDGEETVVGFGFVGEYADSVLVVDKVVFD